ncbi:PKSN polyketide synthase for alternapyrone biosynthesis protein [Colletotrichum plurivorum]|uniref:PKSN polyketide synthase for alternapyrone biosynthesis protein n=1 Tax=Colletotrichum plurivorum TaxID=2175906 RepID=A0A8H6NGP5_9PEZI|nr:PKSN polyketide synthase for alternapyrone biosynthesis protein [Colletotrichum plurivorum]
MTTMSLSAAESQQEPWFVTTSNDAASDSALGTESSPARSPVPTIGSPGPLGKDTDEPIAVIGMACRFSGANSPSKLWEMISSGRSGHSAVPERSWSSEAWYHPSRHRAGSICATSGHFLDNVSGFDAPFFSVTANEAAAMDPMQRLGLEIAYETFENGKLMVETRTGIPMQKLAKSTTAVYSGVMTNDYQMLAEADPYRLGVNSAAGTGRAMLSNRISWFFDFHGPSLTVDTACSSSLHAVHLACQSIRVGESDQALVTGQNLILNPTLDSQLSSMHMTSPDGISHSFDASANGYGRGEGIAGVVLKRLSSALADGDVIRAVIRATGVNSDGKTPGITVPSEDAQAELIQRVYERANLDMARTAYFEAHGTGTPKGDPIEVRALRATIAAARKRHGAGPLYVGSVKPNIGHTEGCAGLAGLIKAVLCLESGVIPPVAGLHEINPELLEPDSNLIFPTAATSWPGTELRRASVNSFGFGGANAHVVLDDARHHLEESQSDGRHITRAADEISVSCMQLTAEAALEDDQETENCPTVFVLSAFDRKGLGRNAKALEAFLTEHKTTSLASLAHTLASKRTAHTFRSFIVAGTREELASRLLTGTDNPAPPVELRSSQSRRLVFLFTGQGAQRPGMAKELLASCPVFRESIASSQKYLRRLGCDWELADVLVHASAEKLNDARYSQPVCTAVQIALVQLLCYWGVVPSAVIGHSSGELTAAFAAGAVSHQDAMRVAYYRGFLATKVCSLVGRPGAMLAVGLSEKDTSQFLAERGLDHDITIACVNSPDSVTLSGPSTAISQAEEALCKAGHFARALRTGGVAYHSPDMKVVGDDFIRCLGPLGSSRHRYLRVPMYSSVTESLVTDTGTLTAAYWHENMTSPVRFAGAMHNLLLSLRDPNTSECSPGLQHCTVLEIGPAKALAGPVGQIMSNMGGSQRFESVRYLSMLSAKEDSRLSTLTAAGMLWSIGVPIDLDKANGLTSSIRELRLSELPLLPSYAWNHDMSYWHDAIPALVGLRGDTTPRVDLLGVPVLPRNPFEPAWQNVVRTNELPWLAEHVVDGAALFPAAGYLAMAIEAVRSLGRERNQAFHGIELLDVKFENSLVLSKDTDDMNQKGQSVALNLKPDAHDDWVFEFAIYAVSAVAEQWRRLAVGTVVGVVAESTGEDGHACFEQQERERQWHEEKRPHLENIKGAARKLIDVEGFYAHLFSIGLEYGPTFRGLNAIRCATDADMEPQGHRKAFGECIVPDSRSVMPESYEHDYLIHPATLDSLFQLVFAALQSGAEMTLAAVPVSVRRVFVASAVPRSSGERLAGAAVSKPFVDEKSGSGQGPDMISGDLTFCDAGFDRLALLVEDVVLRQILSPALSNPADAGNQVDDTEDSSLHRTAQILWKEDIDQSFGRWRDRILQEPSLTARAAFILDRFCHKRAHSKVLCLGLDDSWDVFYAEDEGCMARPEDCTFFDTFRNWEDKLRDQSQQPPSNSDMVFLNSSALTSEERPDRTCPSQYDWIPSALAKVCVPDAWLVIIGDNSSNAAVAEQLLGSPMTRSGFSVILLSESCIDLLSGHENLDPIGPPPRDTPGVTGEPGDAKLLPELCEHEDGVLIIGPEGDANTAHPLAGFRQDVRDILLNSLSSLGIRSCYMTLDEAVATHGNLQNRPIVSLVEFGAPFVYDWSSKQLNQFRKLVSSSLCILWLTTAGFMAPSSETMLQYAPTVGLLRNIRAEFPDLAIPLLDFSTHQRPEHAANMVLEVLQSNLAHVARESGSQVGSARRQTMPESEVSELDGRLFIPRVLAHAESDRHIASETSGRQPVHLTPFVQGKMQDIAASAGESPELWVKAHDKAYWVSRDSEERNPLDAGKSSIRLRYAVTHADDMVKTADKSPYKAMVAQQTVGVVETLSGGRNTDIFGTIVGPGDVVLDITRRPVRPMFLQNTEGLIRVPDSLVKSLAALAYWLVPLSTAFHILSEMANISPGDSLLVDVGDDTVLQESLLQVSKCLGVGKVFICADNLSPGLDSSLDASAVRLPRISLTSASLIRQATGGISVVVSKMSSPGNVRRLQMVSADDVRVVGVNCSSRNEALKGSPFLKRVTRFLDLHNTFSDLRHHVAFEKALSTVLRWVELERIALAQPLRQLSAADTQLARTYMPDTAPTGHDETRRVLLSIPASDVTVFHRQSMVSTTHGAGNATILDPKGTYIISGGLGALGLPLAKMLCNLGARRLVLLSRSGKPATADAVSALEDLAAKGCCAEVVRCDIASKDDVEMLADRLNRDQDFRLRGVVQSAMVLADSTFSNMTMDQWRAATGPKIQGSWNLHNLATHFLSSNHDDGQGCRGLDFFILLSSVSGVIGNSAQANYCAGNTFEDALAHFRRANGLPATSLNIGLVSDSSHFGKGSMESYDSVEKYLARFGHLAPVTVTTEEVLASVKMVLARSRSSGPTQGPAQLIVGISNRIPRHEDLMNRWPMDRKFDHRAASGMARGPGSGAGRQPSGKCGIDEMMASARDIDQARQFVEEVMREKVAQATGMEPDSIDAERSLLAYGIDSLKATEVRNWVKKNLKSELSVFDILSPAPISTLSLMISTRSKMLNSFRDSSNDASVGAIL